MEQWPPLYGLLCSYTYMYIYLIELHYISVHDTQHPIKWGGNGGEGGGVTYILNFNSYGHGTVKTHEKLL